MKTLTIKDQIIKKQAELIEKVSRITGLSHDGINQLIFSHGMSYMEALGEESIVTAFTEEPIYWAWWKQQWALIDETFINDIESGLMSHTKPISYYENLHRQIDTFPDAVVWAQIHKSYEAMSNKIIRQHKQKHNAI